MISMAEGVDVTTINPDPESVSGPHGRGPPTDHRARSTNMATSLMQEALSAEESVAAIAKVSTLPKPCTLQGSDR